MSQAEARINIDKALKAMEEGRGQNAWVFAAIAISEALMGLDANSKVNLEKLGDDIRWREEGQTDDYPA